MIGFIEAVGLGLVQGITEFLPISSSGHLILVSEWLGWPDQGLAFDVAVHLGTLMAVLIYFLTAPCESFLGSLDSCSLGPILAYTAFIGSVMVSYLRARSEGLGIECKVGIMTRPERVVAVGIGLIISEWVSIVILIVLAIITLLGLFTTVQRLIHSSIMLRKPE